VWDSYGRFTSASDTDAGSAFEKYLAALEREERAAEVYRDQMKVVDHVLGGDSDHQPAATQRALGVRQQKSQRP
jgi:hypothetical protein